MIPLLFVVTMPLYFATFRRIIYVLRGRCGVNEGWTPGMDSLPGDSL